MRLHHKVLGVNVDAGNGDPAGVCDVSRDPVLAAASELDAARRPYVLATVVWRRRPTSG